MNKEQQDKLWNELSEETQQEYREKYKFHLADSKREMKCKDGGYDLTVLRSETIVKELETMFGSHNLNPKPQIKTWKDIQKVYKDWPKTDSGHKVDKMCSAAAQIAVLIELGYGGMVSEEEKKDTSIDIYNIYPDEKKQFIIGCLNTRFYDFICFHTRQQAKEFMSHESNRKLVEQYYCL